MKTAEEQVIDEINAAGYDIDRSGNVTRKNRVLKPCLVRGYVQIKLQMNGRQRSYLVHRLVAMKFLPNPHNLPAVNHEDGNKLNNHVSNLTWVTHKENVIHSFRTGLKVGSFTGKVGHDHHRSKAVIQLTANGEFVAEYGSIRQAAKSVKVAERSIYSVIRGKRKSISGFSWILKALNPTPKTEGTSI